MYRWDNGMFTILQTRRGQVLSILQTEQDRIGEYVERKYDSRMGAYDSGPPSARFPEWKQTRSNTKEPRRKST
jgi:hypothetical protein